MGLKNKYKLILMIAMLLSGSCYAQTQLLSLEELESKRWERYGSSAWNYDKFRRGISKMVTIQPNIYKLKDSVFKIRIENGYATDSIFFEPNDFPNLQALEIELRPVSSTKNPRHVGFPPVSFPVGLEKFKNLQILKFIAYQLFAEGCYHTSTNFPKEILALKELKVLTLRAPYMEIGSELSELKNLEYFSMEMNNLFVPFIPLAKHPNLKGVHIGVYNEGIPPSQVVGPVADHYSEYVFLNQVLPAGGIYLDSFPYLSNDFSRLINQGFYENLKSKNGAFELSLYHWAKSFYDLPEKAINIEMDHAKEKPWIQGFMKDGHKDSIWMFYRQPEGFMTYKDYRPDKVDSLKKFPENGPWQFNYLDGKPAIIGAFKNGEMHGVWTLYGKEGQVTQIRDYKEGKRKGVWKIYNTDGTLNTEVIFNMKEDSSEWIHYGIDKNGEIKSSITHIKKGVISSN